MSAPPALAARLVKLALPDWTAIYCAETAPTNGWRPAMPRDSFDDEIDVGPGGGFLP